MTPRELHLFFRGCEKAIERADKSAWKRAMVQAFHTERFARLKRLSASDLKKLLDQIDSGGTAKKPMSQRQLWDMIQVTHQLITTSKQQKRRRR